MSTFGIAARLIAFRLNRVRIVDGVLVGTSEDSIAGADLVDHDGVAVFHVAGAGGEHLADRKSVV